MTKNNYKGKFIVFEGQDGSGQSTQVKYLKDFLERRSHQVVSTKEPTLDSQAGRKIKKVLDEEIKMDSAELQKLYVQDRKEHLDNLIIPALESGKIVISDRYFLSTCAFGGIDLDIEWLIELNQNFILPDITFILDISPEICLTRIKKRGKDIQFFEKKEKLTIVRRNYQLLAKRFNNTYLINGELSKEEVSNKVKEIIIDKFKI